MVLLDFLTSYDQLGTPSTSGLVSVVASGYLGSGLQLSQPTFYGNFVPFGSGGPVLSGIPFGSSIYYEPSGGFIRFNSSSGTLYGQPFNSGLLRLLPSGTLENKSVFFNRTPPSVSSTESASLSISSITYSYTSPRKSSNVPGGASGGQSGEGQSGGGQSSGVWNEEGLRNTMLLGGISRQAYQSIIDSLRS